MHMLFFTASLLTLESGRKVSYCLFYFVHGGIHKYTTWKNCLMSKSFSVFGFRKYEPSNGNYIVLQLKYILLTINGSLQNTLVGSKKLMTLLNIMNKWNGNWKTYFNDKPTVKNSCWALMLWSICSFILKCSDKMQYFKCYVQQHGR